MSGRSDNYHIHIEGGQSPLSLNLKEIWRYRDLIVLFTRRTMALKYKQTVLGPLWLVVAPFLTSVVYAAVFKGIAGISTEGVPALLFYLCSHSLWNFFSSCLKRNSATFISNANIFGKVYFPRLAISFSTVLSALLEFLIEFGMILMILLFYALKGEAHPSLVLIPLLPFVILTTGMMGMGLGVLVSSMTTKYKDLSLLVDFGVSLWMYATPVVYPLSQLNEGGTLYRLMALNPMTAPMELFRKIMLGQGSINMLSVVISLVFTAVALIGGMLIFNKVERSFIDTI